MARWQYPATQVRHACVKDLGLKSDLNMHRARSGSFRVRIEARHEWVEPRDFRKADLGAVNAYAVTPSPEYGKRALWERDVYITHEAELPAAARNLIPLSRFPQGKAGAGMVPPTPRTLRASQNRWPASMQRLPPQEGFQSAPLKPPLRDPPGWPQPMYSLPMVGPQPR
jgi:hypothetical protein